VTHDQEEALTMSDRLAVFNEGKIEQIGSPLEVYEHPATAFVANFVGVSNLVSGTLAQALTGSPQLFAIRPEKIEIAAPNTDVAEHTASAVGYIQDVLYLGMYTRYRVQLQPEGCLTVIEQNRDKPRWHQGENVRLLWEKIHASAVVDAP